MGINRGGGRKQRVNVACSVTAEVIAAFALFFHSWFYLTLDHPTQFLKSPGFSFKVVSVVNAQAHNYHPSAFKLNWNCITSGCLLFAAQFHVCWDIMTHHLRLARCIQYRITFEVLPFPQADGCSSFHWTGWKPHVALSSVWCCSHLSDDKLNTYYLGMDFVFVW